MTRLMLSLTIVAMLLLSHAGVAQACPMCKDTIATTDTAAAQNQYGSGQQSSLPKGFNFSIYYMLGGLFCTIGLVAGVITKGIRDSNAAMRRRGFDLQQRQTH